MMPETGILCNIREVWKRASAKYRESNRERYLESKRKYYRAHREIIINKEHARRSIEGSYTILEWLDLCDHYENRCAACGKFSAVLTVDHVVPLSKGGSNYIDNIQPLCKSCNCRKHDKIIDYRKKV